MNSKKLEPNAGSWSSNGKHSHPLKEKPMSTTIVQKFDRSMIEAYLQERDFKYLTDRDGDFRLDFVYDEETDCEPSVWFITEGEENEIFVMRGLSNKRIRKEDWEKATNLCNEWNQKRRWPKAYLNVREPEESTASIHLEFQIDLEHGIHQDLLNSMAATFLASSFNFWRWLHQEQGM